MKNTRLKQSKEQLVKKIALYLIALVSLTTWTENVKGLKMEKHSVNDKIKMRIGTHSFTVTLLDNETTKRFKEILPVTIQMRDLHNNEKFYDLPGLLPTNESNPDVIKAGDVKLYGSNTLVVFYKSFSTSYSYTSIGQVDDPSKLLTALGPGDVTITFE